MFTLAMLMTLGTLPGPDSCVPDDAKNRAMTAEAEAVARKLLPSTKARGTCELFGRTRQVNLEDATLEVDDVKFLVTSMAMSSTDGAWTLVPFASVDAAKELAARITSHALVKVISPGKLVCRASTDSPGRVAWIRCRAPKDVPNQFVSWSTPSSGHMPGDVTEFEFRFDARQDGSCGCTPFSLQNFSAPMASLPVDAPGWCQGKELESVKKFLSTAKAPVQVTIAQWHRFSVRLRGADGQEFENELIGSTCACSAPPTCAK